MNTEKYSSVFLQKQIRHIETSDRTYKEKLNTLGYLVIRKLMLERLWPRYPDQLTKPLTERDKIIIPEPISFYLKDLEKANNLFDFNWDTFESSYIETFLKVTDFFLYKKEQEDDMNEQKWQQSASDFRKKFGLNQPKIDPEIEKLKKEFIELLNNSHEKETFIHTALENTKTLLENIDIKEDDDMFLLKANIDSIDFLKKKRPEYIEKFDLIFTKLLNKITTNNLISDETFKEFLNEHELALYIPDTNICLFLYLKQNYNMEFQIMPKIPVKDNFDEMEKYIDSIPKIPYSFKSKEELQKVFSILETLGFKDAQNLYAD